MKTTICKKNEKEKRSKRERDRNEIVKILVLEKLGMKKPKGLNIFPGALLEVSLGRDWKMVT